MDYSKLEVLLGLQLQPVATNSNSSGQESGFAEVKISTFNIQTSFW